MMPAARPRERGIVLVAVLLALTTLAALAAVFLSGSRTHIKVAVNLADHARLRAAADAGIHMQLAQLIGGDPTALPAQDGTPRTTTFEGFDLELRVQAAAGLIDLNVADANLLTRLFTTLDIDPTPAAALADAILDYRDPDEFLHPAGAEDDAYRVAGLPYGAADKPFVNIAEVQRVIGMTPEVYAALRPAVTVHGRRRVPDSATAPPLVRDVLGLVTDLPVATDTPDAPERPVVRRRNAVLILRATARAADGAALTREAVIRLRRDPRAPYQVIDWTTPWPHAIKQDATATDAE